MPGFRHTHMKDGRYMFAGEFSTIILSKHCQVGRCRLERCYGRTIAFSCSSMANGAILFVQFVTGITGCWLNRDFLDLRLLGSSEAYREKQRGQQYHRASYRSDHAFLLSK